VERLVAKIEKGAINFLKSTIETIAETKNWDLSNHIVVTRVVEYPLDDEEDFYCVVHPEIGKKRYKHECQNIIIVPRFPWIKMVQTRSPPSRSVYTVMKNQITNMATLHPQPPKSEVYQYAPFSNKVEQWTPRLFNPPSLPVLPRGVNIAKPYGRAYAGQKLPLKRDLNNLPYVVTDPSHNNNNAISNNNNNNANNNNNNNVNNNNVSTNKVAPSTDERNVVGSRIARKICAPKPVPKAPPKAPPKPIPIFNPSTLSAFTPLHKEKIADTTVDQTKPSAQQSKTSIQYTSDFNLLLYFI